jgi:replication-associated recombination protein RarA
MGHFADVVTPGGYLAGEVASALQKSLRRGLEREALHWASELDLAGYGNYVFKRLRIIASEDVGPANSMIALQVRALYENWLEARKGHKQTDDQGNRVFAIGERLFLVHSIMILARAPKSRIVDHAVMVMYERDREPLEMPDWALDKHTARGRRLGRGFEHFFDHGARLANAGEVDDPYADEARAACLVAQTKEAR